MTDQATKLRAVYLSVIVVFSVFAGTMTFGGTALAVTTNMGTVSVGNSPSVNVADATINATTDSNVSIALNVSEEGVSRDNLQLVVRNSSEPFNSLNTQTLDEANISGLNGTGNVTIPSNKITSDNDFTLKVEATTGSGEGGEVPGGGGGPVATGQSSQLGITVTDSGTLGGGNTYINGTVTNTSGAPLSNAFVLALEVGSNGRPKSGGTEKTGGTGSNGNYNLSVSAGTYWIIADVADDYQFKINEGNTVTSGSTTNVDVQLEPFPEKGWINGTYLDSNGDPVNGAQVNARDLGYQFSGSNQTYSNGIFNISVPAANYRVSASPGPGSSVPSEQLPNVTVRGGETTEVTLQPPASGFITGTVTNASGSSQQNAQIFVQGEGERIFFSNTDSNGEYNITAPAGDYTVSVFDRQGTAPSQDVTVTEGSDTQADFTLKNVSVLHSSVEVTSGSSYVSTGDVGVRSIIDRSGLLRVAVVDNTNYEPGFGGPADLNTLGANKSTEFRVNLTVTNFSANALLWGINDSRWSASENTSVDNATDITIRGSPINLQATLASAAGGESKTYGAVFESNPSWATGREDRADAGTNNTIFFSVSTLANLNESRQSTLSGLRVNTNAQKFTVPTLVNQTLNVWVAAPTTTIGGEDHNGFYEVEIPDAQLNEWNVDDPESELSVEYKGNPADNATVTNTDSGAEVRISNISYSAGDADITPNPVSTDSTSTSTSTGGGGGGGGGGGAPETTVTTTTDTDSGTEATIERVTLDDPTVSVSTTASAGGVSVTEASATFDKASNTENTMSISASTSPPSSAPSPPNADGVVSYVDVTVEGSLADDVTEGRFTLDVGDTGLDPADVSAQRYDGSEWQDVETEPLDESTVEVISPDGYSAFAIGASESSEPEQPTATQTPIETDTPVETPTSADTPAGTPTPTLGADGSTQTPEPTATPTPAPTPTPGAGGPGFGVVVALLALVATLAALRRR